VPTCTAIPRVRLWQVRLRVWTRFLIRMTTSARWWIVSCRSRKASQHLNKLGLTWNRYPKHAFGILGNFGACWLID
jgi:hypothetical protein